MMNFNHKKYANEMSKLLMPLKMNIIIYIQFNSPTFEHTLIIFTLVFFLKLYLCQYIFFG